MSNNQSATTQFHFNKLGEDDLKEWGKILVLNQVEVKIWSKGNEDNAQFFSPTKYQSAKKSLWLGFKSEKSDLIDAEIYLQAEREGVHLFGQTKLLYSEKEKSHYLILEGDFYKSQQRIQLRIKSMPERGITIKVLIEDKEYEGIDLSFGGASFFTDQKLEVGQNINEIKVVIENESFLIPRTTVVKIFDDEGREGQKKVALNFVKIPHDTEIKITKKVEALKKKINEK
ncbi:MAG: hypothetical protein DRQ88_03195 [Epsilonproteobacteria bacterium]|nr:MAG: hypothetical protein DRQ89_01565 [Campylobacterota bacterium]RLA67326.1 MAG: hypothetical protein DRQ88_03195 [Campylobacterota bacterium]